MHAQKIVRLFGFLAALLVACSDLPFDRPSATLGQGGACMPADAPCVVSFAYPLGHEQSVVVRGDFASDGWTVGVPLSIDGGQWRTSIAAPRAATVRYKFFIDGMTWVTDPANPSKEPDGLGGENSITSARCDAPACDPKGGPGPAAGSFDWRSAVLYFVFVDRFSNGDTGNDYAVAGVEAPANYQGGDYAGLLGAIESGYFNSLGVSALWLTVPMDNPNASGAGSDGHAYSAYHGYWPTDLSKVEEHFGDLALLKQVTQAAHDRGIRVLFDYAMNHVHQAAPIYQQHPDWFWPLDYNGNTCVCGIGCDWNDTYEQRRCWFRDYLPDWNFQNPSARAYSVDNAVQWIKDTGIDGYRLDAVKHIETEWISDLRGRVTAEIEPASGTHFYMVGETFESQDRDIIKKYMGPALLDGQFDFPLRGVLVDTILRRSGSMHDLDGFLTTNDSFYGSGVMSTFIGNHDLARVIHTALDQPWGAWDNGGTDNWLNPPSLPDSRAPFERLGVAFTFLFTTKGIPLIYYGDEIGMAGAGDPDNRRFMQWDGYSSHQEYLLAHVKKLGAIRRSHPALWKGSRTTVAVGTDGYGYRMSDGDDEVYVALNRGDLTIALSGMPPQGQDLLTDTPVNGPAVTLPPRSAMVIVRR